MKNGCLYFNFRIIILGFAINAKRGVVFRLVDYADGDRHLL